MHIRFNSQVLSKNVLYVCHKVNTFPAETFPAETFVLSLCTSKMETGWPGKANEEAVWVRCQLMFNIHTNILVLIYFIIFLSVRMDFIF